MREESVTLLCQPCFQNRAVDLRELRGDLSAALVKVAAHGGVWGCDDSVEIGSQAYKHEGTVQDPAETAGLRPPGRDQRAGQVANQRGDYLKLREVQVQRSLRLTIPMRMKRGGGRVWITDEAGAQAITPSPDQSLAAALKQAHALVRKKARSDGAADMTFASTYERRLMQLAFLAPDLQLAILDGRQPVGMNLQSLINTAIPPAWADQQWMFKCATEAA
jgi:hypothetical protein